jgi:hypothetical protein
VRKQEAKGFSLSVGLALEAFFLTLVVSFVRSFFFYKGTTIKVREKEKKYTHDGDHHHVFWVAESKKKKKYQTN